jgi:hypothetical protein
VRRADLSAAARHLDALERVRRAARHFLSLRRNPDANRRDLLAAESYLETVLRDAEHG